MIAGVSEGKQIESIKATALQIFGRSNAESKLYFYMHVRNVLSLRGCIILSMAMKSFLDQNQLLHLLKHGGHRHSGVQVRFLECVVIERPFNLAFFFFLSFFKLWKLPSD